MEPFLQLLLKSKTDIEFPSDDPTRLLYAIRDGLKVAEAMPNSPYANLKNEWVLRNKGNRIVAERRNKVFTPVYSLAASMKGMIVPEVTEVIGAIAYITKHKAPKYEFVNFKATGNPLKMIENLCTKNNYEVIQSEPYLIVEKKVEQTNGSEDGGVEQP